jgi:hypothetical protein
MWALIIIMLILDCSQENVPPGSAITAAELPCASVDLQDI